jgi:hypothetical protein
MAFQFCAQVQHAQQQLPQEDTSPDHVFELMEHVKTFHQALSRAERAIIE